MMTCCTFPTEPITGSGWGVSMLLSGGLAVQAGHIRKTKRLQKNLKKISNMPFINLSQNPEGKSANHDGSNFTGQSLNGRTVIKGNRD